jgi:putative ABC transport system permease protein
MLRNYLKLALKVLLRRKVFTAISLIGISLTLVVIMVATALLDNVFAPRAPETRADRTLGLYSVRQYGQNGTSMTTNPGYKLVDRYVRTLPGAERVTAFSQIEAMTLYAGSQKVEGYSKRTDAEYWRILDFRFLEGAPFSATDDQNGAPVAVINVATRDRLFGSGPAVGRTFEFDGRKFRVVGVVPNVPFTRVAGFSDIWVPIGSARSSAFRDEMMGQYFALVLAHSRSDFASLKNAFASRLPQIPLTDPKMFDHYSAGLDTPFEAFSRAIFGPGLPESHPGRMLAILITLGLLFLVLPSLNLVTINLSRIMERASEIGVRKAFGASSATLVGQFVVENVVLTLIGGLIGYILSALVLAALNRSGLIPYAEFDLNLRIFGYGVLAAAVFGLVSGVLPAFRMSRLNAVDALRGGSL